MIGVGTGARRVGVNLDDQAVRADRSRGQGHRSDQGAMSGAVRGVDDDGQVGQLAQDGHRGKVERVARRRLEGADASFTQDHVGVARGEDVLGGHQPLLDGRAEAAFQEHRPATLAHRTQ